MSSLFNSVNNRSVATRHSTNSSSSKPSRLVEKIRELFAISVASKSIELHTMPARSLEELFANHTDDSEKAKITPRTWTQIIQQRHVPKDDSPQTPSYLQVNAAAKASELAALLKKINAPKMR